MNIQLGGRPAFVLVYGQSMGNKVIKVSTARHWIVVKGLSRSQREAVGLGIFLSASQTFERFQGAIPITSDSSFSSEDLVSNVIGFYSAFRGVDQAAMRRLCGEVGIEASYRIWDTHVPGGLGKQKIYDYKKPILYPCRECSGANTSFPKELLELKAESPGALYVATEQRFIDGRLVNAGVPLKFDASGRMTVNR